MERYSVMKSSCSKKGGPNTPGSVNENRPNKTEIKRATKHLRNGRAASPEDFKNWRGVMPLSTGETEKRSGETNAV